MQERACDLPARLGQLVLYGPIAIKTAGIRPMDTTSNPTTVLENMEEAENEGESPDETRSETIEGL